MPTGVCNTPASECNSSLLIVIWVHKNTEKKCECFDLESECATNLERKTSIVTTLVNIYDIKDNLESCFLNDCETSETEGRNGLTEICMPNLDSACPKTYKPIKPIILTIFKNFPFNIKEGTIPNRPMQPFGHSVRLFGHLVIRPIQGTEATQIDSDPQIQIYGSIEDSVLRHLYYNSIFHDMQYCSADRTF